MNKNVCLIGNPNCGKTTLFNALTGTNQKTGNYSGVTTESKMGKYKLDKNITIVDLPGLYSLSPYAQDEKAVIDYIKTSKIDLIINVIDGTNLERNLALTCALTKLNLPLILAINFCDELEKNDIKINAEYLEKLLTVRVILISAKKGKNLNALMTAVSNYKTLPKKINSIKGFNQETEIDGVNAFIENNVDKIIDKKQTAVERFTLKADKILLNKYLCMPIFVLVISLVYFLSLKIGGFLSGGVTKLIANLSNNVRLVFTAQNIPVWLTDLLCGGIIKGIGTVLAFLPHILVLSALMAVIEESGYTARITFIFDSILSKLGLGGRSLISFVLASGCTASGLSAVKTIENKNEKLLTIFLTPFIPCSAKLAVFGWFSFAFFGGSALVATLAYFLSLVAVILFALILKAFRAFNVGDSSFILEMPLLRAPSLKSVTASLYRKIIEFLTKAGSVVFLISVVIWLTTNFGFKGYTSGNIENSFLYIIANGIKFIFYPLGFDSWQCTVALIIGTLAKEGVIQTFELLGGAWGLFKNSYAIYSFLSFLLFSPPCVASLLTAKKELNDNKLFVKMLIFQLACGYSVAMIINLIGNLSTLNNGLLLSIIFVIIIILGLVISLKKVSTCSSCAGCGKYKCKKHIKHNTTICVKAKLKKKTQCIPKNG